MHNSSLKGLIEALQSQNFKTDKFKEIFEILLTTTTLGEFPLYYHWRYNGNSWEINIKNFPTLIIPHNKDNIEISLTINFWTSPITVQEIEVISQFEDELKDLNVDYKIEGENLDKYWIISVEPLDKLYHLYFLIEKYHKMAPILWW